MSNGFFTEKSTKKQMEYTGEIIIAQAWIGAAIAAAAAIGMGLLNRRSQKKDQKELTKQQIEAQKELSRDNQKIGLENWESTNFLQQRQQMEKAGINPGLMYSKGGGQGMGVTPAGSVTGGQANPNAIEGGMGQTIQGMRMAQELKNLKAEERKTNAEADNLEGVDRGLKEAQTGSIIQATNNAKLDGEIKGFQKAITEIEANIANETQDAAIRKIEAERDKLMGEAGSAITKAEIDYETKQQIIKQINQATTEQQVRIGAMKQGIATQQKQVQVMATQIVNMNAERRQQWANWEQGEKERWVREMLAGLQKQGVEFSTGTAAQVKQWTSIINDIMAVTPTPTPRKIGF